MQIGSKQFQIGTRTYILGILNITPDSFYDGNDYNTIQKALSRTQQMILEGVDIIDIGGESTRPDYKSISVESELSRVIPIIQEIKKNYHIPISIDTQKYQVAREAVEAGANMINDIWGLRDMDMLNFVSSTQLPCVIMHNQSEISSGDIISNLQKYFETKISFAQKQGIKLENIIIDVGIGFAKTVEQNINIIKNLSKFTNFGVPLLLGASNKSLFSQVGLSKENRIEATIASSVIASQAGVSFVRVHNVGENIRALRFADHIFREQND